LATRSVWVAGLLWLAAGGATYAAAPPTDDTVPAGPSSLIEIPDGCPQPEQAVLAFTGTAMGKDDIAQVVRFRIDQLRAGSTSDWAIDGLIDVRFGDDYRFLEVGDQYLVGAGFDTEYGALSSRVRPPEPDFGGNDVVGVDDSSVECPTVDDPVRTLMVDGTDVDSGVMSLLFDDRRVVLATIAVPTAIALVALIALAIVRLLLGLAGKGVFQLGRAAVTPVPDHRAVRIRRHRASDGHTEEELWIDGRPVDDPSHVEDQLTR
jgi:hypothetical protein